MTNSSYIKCNDKTFLFDGKSIRQEKDRGKGKSRVKIKETNGVFFSIQTEIERPSFGRWLLRISDYVPGIPLRVKSRLDPISTAHLIF